MNVSTGGAYVATYEPLPPGTPIVIELEYPGKTVPVLAQTIHQAPPASTEDSTIFTAGMGASFDDPDDPKVIELVQLGKPLADRGGRRRQLR